MVPKHSLDDHVVAHHVGDRAGAVSDQLHHRRGIERPKVEERMRRMVGGVLLYPG
jgi:hypothetical protein